MKSNQEEYHNFRASLRSFLSEAAHPYIDQWEFDQSIDRLFWEDIGAAGFLGICTPKVYGGAGLDKRYLCILAQETSRCFSGGFSAAIVGHVSLAMEYINAFASDAIKNKYLPDSCKGTKIGCLAITEPNTGSDVANIKAEAKDVGDYYLINGTKTFITNGHFADYIVLAAKTDMQKKSAGISLFVVDKNIPGIHSKQLNKLGWHASDTAEIFLDQVKIPKNQLIGELNMGFYYIMQNFALERLILSIGAVESSLFVLMFTLENIHSNVFQAKNEFLNQVFRHRVAQLMAELECLKVYNDCIIEAMCNDENVMNACAKTKLLATELSDKVMTECIQLLGANGYIEDNKVARSFRDSRLGRIGGGTSEIMKEIISKFEIDLIN